MLNLQTKLKVDESLVQARNLVDRFSEDDLCAIGQWAARGYRADIDSRAGWMRRNQAALDLALQVTAEKSFPWSGCSNIAFPLVTIATLQFHSRAYPALVSGPEVVRYRTAQLDDGGQTASRAQRIGEHMSYQVLEEDQPWEEQHDRLLINVPIVGCAFKKSYYSASLGHNVSELVMAKDLVMDYYAKSVEDASRKTHVIPVSRNTIYERVKRGVYKDCLKEGWFTNPSKPSADDNVSSVDNRTGLSPGEPDELTPVILLEQHCFLDVDGDGYAEPFVITFEETSCCILRIVARFDRIEDVEKNDKGEIISIKPVEYFTKYGFIPSPDGSVYDIGFGVLLGPLNETVNTIVNQLVDAGTMATTAGGFLGRGAKIRGGEYGFSPLEWRRVDSTGDDLRKNIVPLPVRDPSAVLFQLLGLIINYADRIPGATEAMVGENPGQNTPAETSRSMVEQGMKVYAAIFKRIWRSMKNEFKKLYRLNAIYLEDTPSLGSPYAATREDYMGDSNQICPVADPNVVSDSMRFMQAQALAERARVVPGYDMAAVEANYLRALRVDGWQNYYVGVEKTGAPSDPKLEIAKLKDATDRMRLQQEHMQFVMQLMADQREIEGKLVEMQARSELMAAEAQGVQAGQQIALINAAIGLMKTHDEALRGRIELALKSIGVKADAKEAGVSAQPHPVAGGIPGMAVPPNYGSRQINSPGLDGGTEGSVGVGSLY